MEQINSDLPLVKKNTKAEKKLTKRQRMIERIIAEREIKSKAESEGNDTISPASGETEEEALTEAQLVWLKRKMVVDRMRPYIDEMSHSSKSPRRSKCLGELVQGFAGTYCLEFLVDQSPTLADVVSRSLRSGNPEEQIHAASLAAIVVIQFGATPAGAEIQRAVLKTAVSKLNDESVAADLREKLAAALGVMTYIAENDVQTTWGIMEQLAAVFSRSCGPLGDVKLPLIPAAEAKVHRAALLSWGLLLLVAEERASELIDRYLGTVTALIHSADVETRVVAGEVLALMYEIARGQESDFEGDDVEQLCAELHSLATDSRKYRAKRDRRMQRASFRHFERAVRDGNEPKIRVRFGIETLMIKTWAGKRIYDAICLFLRDGMNEHLNSNSVVRDVLGLGDPITLRLKKCRAPKPDPFDAKMRTKQMAQLRHKRMDFM